MKLFGAHLSPFYERAVIVLDIKGALDKVRLEMPPGGLGSTDHLAHTPTGKIPYLMLDDGTVLIEGQVIAEYFDRVFDGPSLTPEHPVEAAKAHMAARLYDLYVVRAFSPVLMAEVFGRRDEAAIDDAVKTAIPKALDELEHFLPGGCSRAVGDRWTIADAALIPFLFQYDTFVKGYGVDAFAGRPKLAAWAEAVGKTDIAARALERMGRTLAMLKASRG